MTTAPNTTFVDTLLNKTSRMGASVRSVCRSENRAAIDDELCAGHVAMEPRFAAITRSQYSGSRFSAARRASGSLQTWRPRGLTLGQLVERRLLYPSHYDKPWVATSSETRTIYRTPRRRANPGERAGSPLRPNSKGGHMFASQYQSVACARPMCDNNLCCRKGSSGPRIAKGAAELQRRRHT